MVIKQWGNSQNIVIDAIPHTIKFPVAFKNYKHCLATIQRGDIPNIIISLYISSANNNGINIVIDYETGQGYSPGTDVANVLWAAIGIG